MVNPGIDEGRRLLQEYYRQMEILELIWRIVKCLAVSVAIVGTVAAITVYQAYFAILAPVLVACLIPSTPGRSFCHLLVLWHMAPIVGGLYPACNDERGIGNYLCQKATQRVCHH